jgi:uncharacterized protein
MKKDILKEILLSQQTRLGLKQPLIQRSQRQKITSKLKSPHATVVMGVRRCGKSTLLTQIMQEHYLDQFYFLNLEDERLLNFTVKDFNLLYEVFVELYGDRKIFFFDEIQNIPQWEIYVRRMQDTGFTFFITGSNASLLSSEMGSKLTGRHLDIELYPYSFTEYCQHSGWQQSFNFYDSKTRAMLLKHFNDYLTHGGMPEYLAYNDPDILVSTYEDILFRDIITRHEIKDIKSLRELGLYFMSNFSKLFSYNKLKNLLQIGSVNTVKNYVNYLENSYLIFTMNQFNYSVGQQMAASKKAYVIDLGIANQIGFQFSKNRGHLLENIVFLALKKQPSEIYYYKTANNLEVDFAIRQGREITQLIQVTQNLVDTKTKTREVKALVTAMDELKLSHGLILTDDHQEEIKIADKTITVSPVYQWLIQNEK